MIVTRQVVQLILLITVILSINKLQEILKHTGQWRIRHLLILHYIMLTLMTLFFMNSPIRAFY